MPARAAARRRRAIRTLFFARDAVVFMRDTMFMLRAACSSSFALYFPPPAILMSRKPLANMPFGFWGTVVGRASGAAAASSGFGAILAVFPSTRRRSRRCIASSISSPAFSEYQRQRNVAKIATATARRKAPNVLVPSSACIAAARQGGGEGGGGVVDATQHGGGGARGTQNPPDGLRVVPRRERRADHEVVDAVEVEVEHGERVAEARVRHRSLEHERGIGVVGVVGGAVRDAHAADLRRARLARAVSAEREVVAPVRVEVARRERAAGVAERDVALKPRVRSDARRRLGKRLLFLLRGGGDVVIARARGRLDVREAWRRRDDARARAALRVALRARL